MILHNELRDGIWISEPSGWFQVDVELNFIQPSFWEALKTDYYQPIELNEEIFEKFGPKKGKIGDDICFYDDRITFITTKGGIRLYIEIESDNYYDTPYGKEFMHLHQLQNLYFALTGEELEIVQECDATM